MICPGLTKIRDFLTVVECYVEKYMTISAGPSEASERFLLPVFVCFCAEQHLVQCLLGVLGIVLRKKY